MISLLYHGDHSGKKIEAKYTDNILLDKVICRIIRDTRKQKLLKNIISTPLTKAEDINYRQDILKDALANKEEFPQLLSLFSRFNTFKKEYYDTVKKIYAFSSNPTEGYLTNLEFSVQTNAYTLKKLLILLDSINNTLSNWTINSRGMNILFKRISGIVNSTHYAELLELSTCFEHYRIAECKSSFEITFNEKGRISEFDLLSVSALNDMNDAVKNTFSFIKRWAITDKQNSPSASLGKNEELVAASLKSVEDAFKFVIKSILDEYSAFFDELQFYECAIIYCESLDSMETNYCFPKFDNHIDVKSLYDLFLLFDLPNPKSVVANNFVMSKNSSGMLIVGDNGSGKTVYMRSCALAYLFAQSGLPVAANEAVLRLCDDFAFHMALSETQRDQENESGRFEYEVAEFDKIMSDLSGNSILFLNEIFQTTDYHEGAEALYHILNFLSQNGVIWVLVSHLTDLEKLFEEDGSIIKIKASTANNYKLL